MSKPVITTDEFGNRYAAVDVAELDEWAWLLSRFQDWLLHSAPETASDWADFVGPCGPRFDDITYTLGYWTTRMSQLAEGRP